MAQFRQLPPPDEPERRRTALERPPVHRVEYPADVPDYADTRGPSEVLGLLEYARVILRRKVLLIAFGVAGALAAIVNTLPQTPIYQAQTTIEIQPVNTDFLNIRQMNPVSDGGEMYSDVQTQMKILQSDSLMSSVVKKLESQKTEEPPISPVNTEAWRRILRLPEPSPKEKRDQAIGTASGSVRIRSVGQTRILEISVDSTNPRTASDFANLLVNEFQEQNMEARIQALQRTSQWLTRQLEEMRVKLERSEDELQSYARKSGLMFTADKNTVSEERLSQLQKSSASRNRRATRWV
jgi:succinoglycan biosynthesis transport protein ExoP